MGGGGEVEGDVAIGVTQSQVDLWVRQGVHEDAEGVWMACLGCVVQGGVTFEIL
jgi:hypothetical protein